MKLDNLAKQADLAVARLAVARLARERPDWLPVLEAAVRVARSAEPHDFAGSWVVDELGRQSGNRRWVNNLRLLVSYGFLEKSGPSTRSGRRAYYRMPNRAGVEAALEAWRSGEKPRELEFIGAGASTEPPHDLGRRAGEITFDPDPWR